MTPQDATVIRHDDLWAAERARKRELGWRNDCGSRACACSGDCLMALESLFLRARAFQRCRPEHRDRAPVLSDGRNVAEMGQACIDCHLATIDDLDEIKRRWLKQSER
jgi:hypothetical protein